MNDRAKRKESVSQIINAAALAVFGAVGAVLVFALDNRSPSVLYWLLLAGSAVSLVASVFCSGLGIARIPENLGLFDRQAKLCLLGFILAVASCFALGPKDASEDRLNQSVLRLEERVGANDRAVASLATRDSILIARVAALQIQLDSLRIQTAARRRVTR